MKRAWDADVILNDGDIATLRSVEDSDADALRQFYGRVSDQSKYLRFFGTHPELTDEDLHRWLDTRGLDKVTLVMEQRGDIIAVAGYEVIPGTVRVADVSFLVQDDMHGKGVGNILLEHLAEIGREGEVERFSAEMLTQNRQMVQVFVRAGYSASPELADGFISVNFKIAPNATSREVMERRELRAEANSLRRLLHPESVTVVGAALADAPFPRVADLAALRQLPAPTDVVVTEYAGEDMRELMESAAAAGAKGVIVVSRSQNPGLSRELARAAVLAARDAGLRALGPAALGIVNTDIGLNITPAPMPCPGRVGLFTQSAGVATLALSHALERDCGLSSFIGAGSFADVTGNDVIQYWSDDPATDVCLLSLDSIGNPRKFFRVLRRLALEKHVVVFLPSRALRSARHYVSDDASPLAVASPRALDDIIRQTGSMVVTRRDAMFDIAQLLSRQPLPRGRRVAVISNSAGLTDQMVAAAQRFGLRPRPETVLGDPAEALPRAVDAAVRDPDIDSVLCTVVDVAEGIIAPTHARLAALEAGDTPLAVSYVGFDIPDVGPELPVFATYADALEAFAEIVDNEVRRRVARPAPDDVVGQGDEAAARAIINEILRDSPTGRWATDEEAAAILAAYGIAIVPWSPARTLPEAIDAAEALGWNVVLKCTSPIVRGRSELPTVLRHLRTPHDVADAWETLTQLSRDLHLGDDPAILEPAVQATVHSGASLTVRAIEDSVIGPMIQVGVAGLPSDLLGDVAWRVPPVRRTDALAMLSELKSAPLLAGYQGTKPAHIAGVEEIITNLARLKDDIAALVDIELTPVIAGVEHTSVVGGRLRVAPLAEERDPLARRLGTP
ncbi:GNAT family N-acetyltransferase [uncultured Corynebacterium sp.]|uniref:GNAT family N-acetyltransferase n=1 Tax=uncultured Corynebacterium sp. TaxID=159447 RepID=UPI0025E6A0B9|nr:GNAT family N-acetyltransferase [uncultured Corynebacterium sp.]